LFLFSRPKPEAQVLGSAFADKLWFHTAETLRSNRSRIKEHEWYWTF